MSHMPPFRLNMQTIPSELSAATGPGASNPKKRRKNGQQQIQTPHNLQDLLPPPLSGYGDTIVASNPFDDCPSTVNTRTGGPMGITPNIGMGVSVNNLNMCRPLGMGIASSLMHSPNSHPNAHMMNNSLMMNGPRLSGPTGMNNHMTQHMMHSPNGPIHSISGPMHSPINNIGPGIQGSITGGIPPGGPGPNGPPQMNGPMSTGMNISSPNGPIGASHNNNFMMNTMNTMYSKPMPVTAGKIYPPDQPMVFNSQNPNAPPIYPCGVCHKEVHDNDQAILCESGCNFWFHRGCSGLTEAAFQLLTAEVYAEWVCDKCLSSKNIPLVKFKP